MVVTVMTVEGNEMQFKQKNMTNLIIMSRIGSHMKLGKVSVVAIIGMIIGSFALSRLCRYKWSI